MEFRTLKDGRRIPIANPTPSSSNSTFRPQPAKPKDYKGFRHREAFTIPNYTCRSCGGSVYYYEHPNGAKVLFDQLGPPWPKHPCYEPKLTVTNATEPASKNKKQQNWQPLFITRAVRLQAGGLRIEAKMQRGKLRFELDAMQVKKLSVDENNCRHTLAMMQCVPGSSLATITLNSGLYQLEVVSTWVKWLTEQVAERHVQVTPAETAQLTPTDLANFFTKPLAAIIKPAKEKTQHSPKDAVPILRLKSQKLQLTELKLEQLSDNYYLVIGKSDNELLTFGLDIKSRQNQNVLSYLIVNPTVITLAPLAKKDKKLYALQQRRLLTGKLELGPDIEAHKSKPVVAQVSSKADDIPEQNPFRNTVLSANMLAELQAKLRLK